jgi:hypothetical protein
MRQEFDIDLIFPMKDEISAGLMCVKAELLCEAGIIGTDELDAVLARAAEVMDSAPGEPAAAGSTDRLFRLQSEIRRIAVPAPRNSDASV